MLHSFLKLINIGQVLLAKKSMTLHGGKPIPSLPCNIGSFIVVPCQPMWPRLVGVL
jgi:hypothetical protein